VWKLGRKWLSGSVQGSTMHALAGGELHQPSQAIPWVQPLSAHRVRGIRHPGREAWTKLAWLEDMRTKQRDRHERLRGGRKISDLE
jgi:hypothetical protein